MLEVKEAATGYGRVRVLDKMSLSLETGKVLAIVGPNGAGKSTLMRTICGANSLWHGSVEYDGQDVSLLSIEERSELGLVLCPEGRGIFGTLTIEENLVIGASALRQTLGRGFRQAVADGIERSYDLFPILKERRKNYGGALSGGQQQMLAIARALMARPKLLLLDEPSLGLAPKLTQEVYDTLSTLKSENLSIVVVEEAAGRALTLADDAIVMRNGQIIRRENAAVLASEDSLGSAYLGLETS